MQVVPELADRVAELIVFQRSPVWVGAKKDPEYSAEEREEFRTNPAALAALRQKLYDAWEYTSVELHKEGTEVNRGAEARARQLIDQSVSNPELARALTSDHNFACKRPTISNRYYATFDKPNVLLVTGAVESMTETGVVSAGENFEVDVLVYATGFKPFNVTNQIEVRGVGGLPLAQVWQDEVTSYNTVMVHDFPNWFFLMGPNGTGLQSALESIEPQSDFAVRAVQYMEREGVRSLNPKQECVDQFTQNVRKRFEGTTHSKGCTSWWSDATGYNHSIWPGSTADYRALLAELNLAEFDIG